MQQVAEWNVVVTTQPDGFPTARKRLRQLGDLHRTEYWNVLVMAVDDLRGFLEEFDALVARDESLANAISRVVPVTHTFRFQSPEEFERKACEIAREWIPALKGATFHVRMHRRGFKGRLSSQAEEQFLDHFILEQLEAENSPGRIGFEDPDYIIAIESVSQQAGLSLWTREDLKRFRLLKLD